MNEDEKNALRERLFGYSEQVKDQIRLGKNTEAGFTGHLARFRNPSGEVVEVELWIGKDLPDLRAHVDLGNMSPEIRANATYIGLEKVRFDNIIIAVLNVARELLEKEKLPLWEFMSLLMEHDE